MPRNQVDHLGLIQHQLTVLTAMCTFFGGMLMSVVSRLSLYEDHFIGAVGTTAMIMFIVTALVSATMNCSLGKVRLDKIQKSMFWCWLSFVVATSLFLTATISIMTNQLPKSPYHQLVTTGTCVLVVVIVKWFVWFVRKDEPVNVQGMRSDVHSEHSNVQEE